MKTNITHLSDRNLRPASRQLLAICLLLCCAAPAATTFSPVGIWQGEILGKDRGTVIIRFYDDGSMGAAGIALSGTFVATGLWDYDPKYGIVGYDTRTVYGPFPGTTAEYFAARVTASGFRLQARIAGTGVTIRATPVAGSPPAAGWWTADGTRASVKSRNYVYLTRFDAQQNTFTLDGDLVGAALMLDNGKAAIALSDPYSGIAEAILVGSINFRRQVGTFKGYGSNGDKITAKVYR